MATTGAGFTFPGQTILSDIVERFKESANVRLIYGEPVTVGERTIVPIAAVFYSFGAGSGGGQGPIQDGHPTGAGGGVGGGGMAVVRPVAVLEVSSGATRVRPVIDWTRVLVAVFGLLKFWLRFRAGRRPHRGA